MEEKRIELKAPLSRVWRAITDSQEFGEWFKVNMDGPFMAGKVATGSFAHPDRAHLKMRMTVKEIRPETYFSYTWNPYGIDPNVDYSKETPTLVEFNLHEIPGGTELVVVESGFDKVPEHRRDEAFRMNTNGWTAQMKNIENYVTNKE